MLFRFEIWPLHSDICEIRRCWIENVLSTHGKPIKISFHFSLWLLLSTVRCVWLCVRTAEWWFSDSMTVSVSFFHRVFVSPILPWLFPIIALHKPHTQSRCQRYFSFTSFRCPSEEWNATTEIGFHKAIEMPKHIFFWFPFRLQHWLTVAVTFP